MATTAVSSETACGEAVVITIGNEQIEPEPSVSVTVHDTVQLLQEGFAYLDVRTQEEFERGHVPGALNIPYMLKYDDDMVKNENFVEEVSKLLNKDENFIVGCQSGRRSLMATKDLIAVGFKGIKDMEGGMNVWIESGYSISVD